MCSEKRFFIFKSNFKRTVRGNGQAVSFKKIKSTFKLLRCVRNLIKVHFPFRKNVRDM